MNDYIHPTLPPFLLLPPPLSPLSMGEMATYVTEACTSAHKLYTKLLLFTLKRLCVISSPGPWWLGNYSLGGLVPPQPPG